jgi:hypothetical protein
MIDYIGVPKKDSSLLLALGVLAFEARRDRVLTHELREW